MTTPSHYDNAVYSDVAAASGKEFTISENKCYGDVGYTKTNAESKAMRKAGSKCSSCVQVSVFPLLAIVIVSLLATVGACITLGLEIAQLKSDTATHQESQNALVSRIESTEILLLQTFLYPPVLLSLPPPPRATTGSGPPMALLCVCTVT